jgi:hypothetical protein
LKELNALAVKITDLSVAPDATPSEPKLLDKLNGDFFHDTDLDVCDGVKVYLDATSEQNLELSVEIIGKETSGLFALIDFYCRSDEEEEWQLLHCEEKHGVSGLRIIAWPRENSVSENDWWRTMRQAAQTEDNAPNPTGLSETLSRLSCEEYQSALKICRELISWKYPTKVWEEYGNSFEKLPVLLGQYRYSLQDKIAGDWWIESVRELADYARAKSLPVTRRFLLGTKRDCLRTPFAMMPVTNQNKVSPTARSLLFSEEIKPYLTLSGYVQKKYHKNEIYKSVFHSFDNWLAIMKGSPIEFHQFSYSSFLGDSNSGLWENTEKLDEEYSRFKVDALLAPEHLLQAVRALNRRCRVLQNVSTRDADLNHPLHNAIQELMQMERGFDTHKMALVDKLEWGDIPDTFPWVPPCIENEWGKRVSQLVFGLAAVSRLGGYRILSPNEYRQQMDRLFLQDSVCAENHLLSLAPELFAFYFILFELALFPRRIT